MMRLQRRLLRSGVAFAGTATAGVPSVFGLTLAFVFAAAIGGPLPAAIGGPLLPVIAGGMLLPAAAGGMLFPACVESGVGAPSTTRAARTGLATSVLGGMNGEVCESTRFASADAGAVPAGLEEAGARTCSVDACGIFGPFGSVSLVATKIDAMSSTITPMTGSDQLRAKSA